MADGPSVPRLLGITPPEFSPERLAELLPELAQSLDAVLLRWPAAGAARILQSARDLADRSPRPILLVSDRLDLALASGVEGVQLKENGIPPEAIPWELRPSLVGVSRHDEEGVLRSDAADYLTLSPLRVTTSKPGAQPLGLERFAELVALSPVPVLALGGVRPEDLESLLRGGAHGAAVCSGIFGQADPPREARRYAKALHDAWRA